MAIVFRLIVSLLLSSSALAQGEVVFANRIEGVFDAPVTIVDARGASGPGPQWTAQLYVQGIGGALTPLVPSQRFGASDGTPASAIADRYLESAINLTVPRVEPGNEATFVMRVWLTALGPFEAAQATGYLFGQSRPFTVTVGGGGLPPAYLTPLEPITIVLPEPGTAALTIGGAFLLAMTRLKHR